MKKISCVSDLHLFCRRSNAEKYFDEIEHAVADSDIFIFNGDTFDFRWSKFDSVEETVEKSIEWLKKIIEKAPHCQFYYILGNHDCTELFITALETLADALPNLEWHPYYVRLGTSLFLHGDVANRKMNAEDLERYRKGWLYEEQRGELPNRILDWVFKLRIHKAIARTVFPTNRTISRIQHYLNDIECGTGSAIENVFFGHTHLLVNDIELNGQRFHNGGAPMPGMAFEVLRTRVSTFT